MKKTLAVMGNEIRTTLGRKTFTLMALGLPLLVGLIALVIIFINRDTGARPPAGAEAATASNGPEAVGYVDEGGLIRTLPSDSADGAGGRGGQCLLCHPCRLPGKR
jgi:hypothetical protein